MQLDPVRDRVIHVDFHEVRLDQPINTVVRVHLEGIPHGVNMGGVLSQPTHELNISVLPTAIAGADRWSTSASSRSATRCAWSTSTAPRA